MIQFCEMNSLASINRTPLGMGLLTGKYKNSSELLPNDVRRTRSGWGTNPNQTIKRSNQALAQIEEQLTSDGRTLAQAALGWIWARSSLTIPIPGFKTSQQIEENVDQGGMQDIDKTEIGGVDDAEGDLVKAVDSGLIADDFGVGGDVEDINIEMETDDIPFTGDITMDIDSPNFMPGIDLPPPPPPFIMVPPPPPPPPPAPPPPPDEISTTNNELPGVPNLPPSID